MLDTDFTSDQKNNEKISKFEIAIDKTIFNNLLKNSKQDPKVKNALKLIGDWANTFSKLIREYENQNKELSLQSNIARIYPDKKRSGVDFFRGTAACRFKGCEAKYQFIVPEKPISESSRFVVVNVCREKEHDHKENSKVQIRGDARTEIAEKVLLKFNGSAAAYVNHAAAQKQSLPSEQVIRNIIHEYHSKENVSTCWITNTLSCSESINQTVKAKRKNGINGYVQDFSLHKDFNLTLHTETQIRLINQVPPNRRILHVDATGGLVQIFKYQKNYNQILNYVMLMKDSMNLNESEYFIINETATSRHDAYSIGSMFRLVKHNYSRINNCNRLKFRLLICDMSWPTIYASLEVFNRDEDIIEYAYRVFRLSKLEINPNDTELTWIGSCNSHTMHRFVKQIKNIPLAPSNYINTTVNDALGQSARHASSQLEASSCDDSSDEEDKKLTFLSFNFVSQNIKSPQFFQSITTSPTETKSLDCQNYTIVELDQIENYNESKTEVNDNVNKRKNIKEEKCIQKKIKTNDQINIQVDIELLVADIGISSDSLNKLKNNERLNDNIMEAFFRAVTNEKKHFILSSTLASGICFEGKTISTIRKKFDKFDLISGPVFKDSHWTLLFVRVREKKIYYIDPFGSSTEKLNQILNNWIEESVILTRDKN
ncbi:unnamed protein product [Brachionus calyciflorus]|uniref:Ubiquitin-like protease family profile domain-containing protein n=1 Tax=Brachionus calyciflorus TaxID=104777 RepID=A0A814ERP8_9BILA|nr:unnamed protein product [Brachionus calyciflorus]